MKNSKKIGLLGGSFDPPHLGHLAVAEHAYAVLGLNEVWLLVTPQNPEKIHQAAPFAHRLAMCAALGEGKDWLKASNFEACVGSPNTRDVLAKLLPAHPHNQFVWLMGADNLKTVHTWDGWDEVMEKMVSVVIYSRPEHVALLQDSHLIHKHKTQQVAADAPFGTPPQWRVIKDFEHPASSTKIRHLVKEDGSAVDTTEAVAAYIEQNQLYRRVA